MYRRRMSFHDELEKQAARSGGRPVSGVNIGKRKLLILYINAKEKKSRLVYSRGIYEE